MFELTLAVKDKMGNPTGQTKTVKSSYAGEIGEFWERYNPENKGKKKQKNKDPNKMMESFRNRLDKLTKLENGWDGKGGVPLNITAGANAYQALNASKDIIRSRVNIMSTSDGKARIELNSIEDKNLEIVFESDNYITVIKYDGKNNINEEYSEIFDSQKVRKLVEWFNNR